MKNRLLLSMIGILCAFSISACGNTKEAEVKEEVQEIAAEETSEAPAGEAAEVPAGELTEEGPVFGEFTAMDREGNEVTQEIFSQADLTMVNIWGTFCGPCISEMPDLGEISKEYEGTGFQIVGIVTDVYEPGDDTMEEIIEVSGADYTHLFLNEELYNNYLNQVQFIPTTVFVDKEGNSLGVYSGAKSKENWIILIEELRAAVTQNQE